MSQISDLSARRMERTVKGVYLDDFTFGYCSAAMFTSDENPGSGEYPANERIHLLTANTLAIMAQDCERFQGIHESLIADAADIYGREAAGRDYWYTRNGHGCGYWDGDLPEELGEALCKAAQAAGEVCIFRTGKYYSL